MYEMYPDDWAANPRPLADGVQPRRRARRAHSVTPSILAQERVIPGSAVADEIPAHQH